MSPISFLYFISCRISCSSRSKVCDYFPYFYEWPGNCPPPSSLCVRGGGGGGAVSEVGFVSHVSDPRCRGFHVEGEGVGVGVGVGGRVAESHDAFCSWGLSNPCCCPWDWPTWTQRVSHAAPSDPYPHHYRLTDSDKKTCKAHKPRHPLPPPTPPPPPSPSRHYPISQSPSFLFPLVPSSPHISCLKTHCFLFLSF